MKKHTLLLFLLITVLSIGLVACGSGNNDDSNQDQADQNEDQGETPEAGDTLVMATSADFPPFESRDVDGEFIGFDIELAKYIAEQLGYELEIEDMNFDGLIGALQSGRADMVLSGMSATEDRRENVDFSIEYNPSSEMFVTRKDSDITSIDDIDGSVIGVQLGSIQQEGAETLQNDYDFEIKALDDAQALIQELLTNRIDIAYFDKEVALGFIEAQDLAGFDDPTSVSPGMAIAFPKGSDLVDDVNAVIEEAIESGWLDELKAKWLSEED